MKVRGMKKIAIGAGAGLLCLSLWNPAKMAFAATQASFSYLEGEEFTAYKGIITIDDLNVRSDAGKTNPVVQLNGGNLTLDDGDEVAIVGQKPVNSEVWYEVRFVKDGTECTGFVHSYYVNKTTEVITPEPTPTLTMTPTPSPTPTVTPAPSLTAAAEPTPPAAPVKTKPFDSGAILKGVFILLALAAAGVLLWLLVMKIRKRSASERSSAETAEKIDTLKAITLQKQGPQTADGTPIPVLKRRDASEHAKERKVYKRTDNMLAEANELAAKERAKQENEEIIEFNRRLEAEDSGRRLEAIAESLKEKEIRKEEIDRMKTGDLVFHEYFGKGVVFDNSDVKVIEVRFGQDVRFLNKASCASKRLLKKI